MALVCFPLAPCMGGHYVAGRKSAGVAGWPQVRASAPFSSESPPWAACGRRGWLHSAVWKRSDQLESLDYGGKQVLQKKSACQGPSWRRCHPTLGAALCHLLLSSEARADPCCPAGQSLAPGVQTGVQGTSLGVLARHEMMTPCSAVMWLYCDLLYLSAGHSGCCLYFFSWLLQLMQQQTLGELQSLSAFQVVIVNPCSPESPCEIGGSFLRVLLPGSFTAFSFLSILGTWRGFRCAWG